MDLLDNEPKRRRWWAIGRLPLAVLIALGLLGVGQGYTLMRNLELPSDVRVEIAEGGYTVGTIAEPSVIAFALRNTGRPVEVRGLRLDAPGLRLLDVIASGGAVGNRRVGGGREPLPTFTLDDTVTLLLRFETTDCREVDGGVYPLLLDLRVGARSGALPLRLRDYPDLLGRDAPDVPWQQVLAAGLCG